MVQIVPLIGFVRKMEVGKLLDGCYKCYINCDIMNQLIVSRAGRAAEGFSVRFPGKMLRVLAVVCAANGLAGGRAEAQYSWTQTAPGTWNWETAGNWAGNNAPPAVATAMVSVPITPTAVTGTQRINFHNDQVFQGGFRLGNYQTTLTINLQDTVNPATSYSLLIDGGTFHMGTSSERNGGTSLRFTGSGSVILGTGSNQANLQAYATAGSSVGTGGTRTIVFDAGTTFVTRNVGAFTVGSNINGSANISQNGALDLSQATLMGWSSSSSSLEAGWLTVNGALGAGLGAHASAPAPNVAVGTIILPSSVARITADSLTLGRFVVAATVNSNSSSTGTLKLGNGASAVMEIAHDFNLGRGEAATGSITDLPTQLHLKVGRDAGDRGAVYVGYRDVVFTSTNAGSNHYVSGTLVSEGGSFNAHITTLNVGVNTIATAGSTAYGMFDMSSAELGLLDVSGQIRIGSGTGAQGTLKLSGGAASSASLSLGESTGLANIGENRSQFSLDGTSYVTGSVTVGDFGDLRIIVGAGSSGIDITGDEDLDFSISGLGKVTVEFNSDDVLWGIRMAGDQRALFEGYLSTDRLAALGTYADQAFVRFDGQYTYYTVPEPSTWCAMILGAAVCGWAGWRRKVRATATE